MVTALLLAAVGSAGAVVCSSGELIEGAVQFCLNKCVRLLPDVGC